LLAKKGFTGHKGIIEGKGGFVSSVMGGECDIDHLVKGGGEFKILKTNMKPYACCSLSTGLVSGTVDLVKTHNIAPADVAQINIRASEWCVEHNGDDAKRFPNNKETADHSAPYLTAIAVMERAMGLDQYSDDRYIDPRVHELIRKVAMTPGPELDNLAAVVEIRTTGGETFSIRADPPKGDFRNRMTKDEVEAKFRSMASKVLPEAQMKTVITTIEELENLTAARDLMSSLAGSASK
jgi:2-methylcitrate dehydratase